MNILIKNGELLLMEGQKLVVKKGDIVVDGKKIEKVVLKEEENRVNRGRSEKFDKIIDATDRLVMPGLINAHTHAYMSIFKNYADDLEFLIGYTRWKK